MKMANQFQLRALTAALAFTALLLLGACAGPRNDPGKTQVAAAYETSSVPDRATVPKTAGPVSLSCKTHADCAIKDVGSCCGYNPRCLNKDSPTFPEQVQAQCAKEGRMGICGFPAITGCECVAGKCAGIAISDNSSLVQ